MADHTLDVCKNEPLPGSDKVSFLLACPDCDVRVNGRIGPAAQADHLFAALTLGHQIHAGGVSCCDMHNRHCEPPSDLCCRWCTEAAHDTFSKPHADGSRCVLDEAGE